MRNEPSAKDSNLQRTFETARIIMAHSISQGSPGFPCVCVLQHIATYVTLGQGKGAEKVTQRTGHPQECNHFWIAGFD